MQTIIEEPIFKGILILLLGAVIATTLFKRLNLPSVLGYLAVGIIVGPNFLGLISNTDEIRELAEFGVVFLMFTIGLEFSLAKLLAMKRLVLGLGGIQVILTTLITVGTVMLWDQASVATALVIGGVVAMSSTAITIKQLNEQLELNTLQGNNALGILLCQDLAVVAFLILIPSLSTGNTNVYLPLFLALLKTVGVMLVIVFAGRWILRPLFYSIAKTKSLELFTLTVLLVTLSAAWLTEHLGLSMALGAFLAGMMLGETEFRHQIEIEIRPFRDVLLGLFFITIGMFLDIHTLPTIWLKVLVLLALIVVFKTILIALISKMFGSDWYTSTRTGLILAHGGEFGFALLSLAFAHRLLTPIHGQVVLTALIFSMAIAPFLIRYNKKITQALLPRASKKNQQSLQETISHAASQLRNHIIICGYGRVGQNIARILETEGFQFVALDMDPQRIQQAQLAGDSVMYGNSMHLSILESAGVAKAKALIISFDDLHTTFKILEQVRKVNPTLPILVRTKDDASLEELQKAGATEVIPETLEASLMMAFHTLLLMDVPPARALRQIRQIRNSRYDLLHRIFPSHDLLDNPEVDNQEQLFVLTLPKEAYAVGKSLQELHLELLHIRLTAIHRKGVRRPDPGAETVLQAGDGLVLYGTPSGLEQAERVLLEGGSE